MNNLNQNEDAEKVKKEIMTESDKYDITVRVLIAIKYFLTKKLEQPYNKFYIGRKMEVTENRSCKPDFCAEREGSPAIIGDIKSGLPQEKKFALNQLFDQIEKFDNVTKGWELTTTQKDIFIFIPDTHRIKINNLLKEVSIGDKTFKGVMKDYDSNKTLKITSSLCFWSYAIEEDNNNPFFNLALEFGKSTNQFITEHAKENIIIEFSHILEELNNFKFYDADPPELYLLTNLWTVVLQLSQENQFIENNIKGKKTITIETSIDQILNKAKSLFITTLDEDRNTIAIRKNLVKKFVNILKKLKLAQDGENEIIKISYSKMSGNIQEFFLDKLIKIKLSENANQYNSLNKFIPNN